MMNEPGAIRGGRTATAADAAPSDLGNILGRLAGLRDELDKHGAALGMLTERVMGSVPDDTGSSKGGPAAVPNGAINEINEAIDGLFRRVERNHGTLNRLGNLA